MDNDSSDSDVELVRPRQVKRRRLLPGTVPVAVSVYSNKVNSSLKLPPDDPTALLHLSKELQTIQGSEDVENEIVAPTAAQQRVKMCELSDSEDDGKETSKNERPCNASPSPPPTPNTPVMKKGWKGRAYSKIREMDAQLKDLGSFLSPPRVSRNEENDVVVVGSSPAPEITIKVRRRGKLYRVNLHMCGPLHPSG
ncbi:hypothetical protein GDO86_017893 [Hymenochirus boettgeri]|uniref:Uncharacterized protein n=1 Tax=Hymenochirus boettgeri TaxID=247094 RepID=A0A8T2IGU2_9PIPI|nr:hypothetical protein GDO86_017893 [Hymenochirus boettgeri]